MQTFRVIPWENTRSSLGKPSLWGCRWVMLWNRLGRWMAAAGEQKHAI